MSKCKENTELILFGQPRKSERASKEEGIKSVRSTETQLRIVADNLAV